jgi:hypothetical protein
MPKNATELIYAVKEAFQKTTYPGDNNLVEDSFYLDVIRTGTVLKGIMWETMPFNIIMEVRHKVFFLTPQAFCYYLPAFLLAILEGNKVDSLPGTLVFELRPDSEGHYYQDRLVHIVECLSTQQKIVLIDFFEFLAEKYLETYDDIEGIQAALEYWKSTLTK